MIAKLVRGESASDKESGDMGGLSVVSHRTTGQHSKIFVLQTRAEEGWNKREIVK